MKIEKRKKEWGIDLLCKLFGRGLGLWHGVKWGERIGVEVFVNGGKRG